VKLPFVDFSSCEKRRAACEAEIAVNRAMAGPLYLDALPITRGPQGLRIGGDGEALDWVVVMRRFPTGHQFDRLAKAGKLTREIVEQAAAVIAEQHAKLAPLTFAGQAVAYRDIIRGLRVTEADGAARLGLEPASSALFERLDAALTSVSALIEARRKQGKVRRGHGDLHLRNICLFENRPMAFDALEFDDRLASTDVLYDFAFLLMDLRRLGLREHANAAMNRYWNVANESEDALALLPFFMALRAGVRMAVAVEAGDLDEAQTYRALGLDLLQTTQPHLIAIGGLSGTGKSAVAAALAPRLPGPAGARLLRSDVLRKLRRDRSAKVLDYTPERRADVYRQLADHAADAVAAGACVVADATFRELSTREAIATAAGAAAFNAYWLFAPLSVRLSRVARRVGDESDAGTEVAASQQDPADISARWRRLDAARTVPAIITDILNDLPAS
jgi:aminoglycoside phosphotransferase family enzyme/predicted kinase